MPTSSTLNKPSNVVMRNGVFFTPDALAKALVEGTSIANGSRILDPACGNGALLRAVRDKFSGVYQRGAKSISLFGCDRLKHDRATSSKPEIKIIQRDFFGFEPTGKFDLIVMNPPYLSGGKLAEKTRSSLRQQYGEVCQLPTTADIWTYFLLKSVKHLEIGGSIAAILPWPFLQATYSMKLREWLADQFESIRALVLGGRQFASTPTRTMLLWMSGYGRPSKQIEMAFSKRLGPTPQYSAVTQSEWAASQAGMVDVLQARRLLDECAARHGFVPLHKYATVRIGVVTGANSFFIRSKGDEVLGAFRQKDRTRILTSGRAVNELRLNGNAVYSYLLHFRPSEEPEHLRVLNAGRRADFHRRSHSTRRHPWHTIIPGPIPDAFFQYRVNETPFISLNDGRYQSTNAIHRLYFNDLTVSQRRWIQISALSVFGQLSIEALGRVYGNGILKLEPAGLKEVLVWTGNTRPLSRHYYKLEKLINSGQRRRAVGFATALVAQACGIAPDLVERAEAILDIIRARRHG